MSASVRAPAIGASVPEGFKLRAYRPSDRDALMEIQLRNHREWHPEQDKFEFFEPTDPTTLGIVVLADENDQPVCALGARAAAEIGTVLDMERIDIFALRDVMMPAWAMLGAMLYKRGERLAFCRVSSPTPGWVAMLKRRLKWRQSRYPHLYFDLDKTFGDPALKDLYEAGRVQ